MNVRFAADAVRCRVTQAEMGELLQSGTLKLLVPLPRNHHFQVTVRAAVLGGWRLDSDPTGLWIEIPRGDVEQLAASLPSREGIEHAFELEGSTTLRLAFEVDVRKRRPSELKPSPALQPGSEAEPPVQMP